MRLLLIRHGETASNAEGRLQGHLDVPLSDRGLHESDLLADRLARLSIAAIYTSPLERARRTAQAAADRLGLPLLERDFLMERDLGALSGLTGEEIATQYPDWRNRRQTAETATPVSGYESDADFSARVIPNLEELVAAHPGGTVAIFTHGGVIATFTRHVLRITTRRTFTISNASISIVEAQHRADSPSPSFQVTSLNDTCHIDKAYPKP